MTQTPPAPPPKAATAYYCKKCNRVVGSIWADQCPNPACRSFNTITRGVPPVSPNQYQDERPLLLSEIPVDPYDRIPTGTREFDRVLGGGLVIGSSVLVSGDPGIGKSTLLLQTASDLTTAEITNKDTGKIEEAITVLYVVAEETPRQVAGRASRITKESKRLYLYYQSNVVEIDKQMMEIQPDVVIIDSIQKMIRPDIEGAPGSISQVKGCSEYLVGICQSRDVGLFIVAHITKEGTIAGPKTLEHLVDVTLEFHKQGHGELRSISASKNRFGSTNEMALFRMSSKGLESIENPSELLVSQHEDGKEGSCLGVTLNGQRGLVCEVQTLLSPMVPLDFMEEVEKIHDGMTARQVMAIFNALKRLQKPGKRNVTGLSTTRVNQLFAVLARRVGIDIREEAWVNLAGGIKIDEAGLDLPIALALASLHLGIALPPKFVAFGEVGLLGEIRPVEYMDVRIKHAGLMGYETIMGPPLAEQEDDEDDDEKPKEVGDEEDLEGKDRYIPVTSLEEALDLLEFQTVKKKPKQAKKPKKKKKSANGQAAAPVVPSAEPT